MHLTAPQITGRIRLPKLHGSYACQALPPMQGPGLGNFVFRKTPKSKGGRRMQITPKKLPSCISLSAPLCSFEAVLLDLLTQLLREVLGTFAHALPEQGLLLLSLKVHQTWRGGKSLLQPDGQCNPAHQSHLIVWQQPEGVVRPWGLRAAAC